MLKNRAGKLSAAEPELRPTQARVGIIQPMVGKNLCLRALALGCIGLLFAGRIAAVPARHQESTDADIVVRTGKPGCSVQLDADPPAKTDGSGRLSFDTVDPTDHYVHVRCPEDQEEAVYLISPRVRQKVELQHNPSGGVTDGSKAGGEVLDVAEARVNLPQLVREGVQLRSQARLDEAVQKLRQAARIDPGNSDLHRELGITFLLAKDWKRARVEMLEALRHDPSDADAHNGLGYALEKLGDMGPALNEYRTATHLDPDDPSYREHYLEALAREAGERQEGRKKK